MAQKQLTPIERQFIKEYLKPSNQFNATQAYLIIKPSVLIPSLKIESFDELPLHVHTIGVAAIIGTIALSSGIRYT